MSGNAIRVAFTSASGGGAFFGALHPLGNVDAIVQSSTVRPAYGIVAFAPTPWGRIQTGVVTTDTATFQLFPVNRWR